VKRSFQMLVNRLTSRDTVSIVTYASGVNIVLEDMNGNKKSRIMDAIQDLEAGGSTAGASGLQMAYDVASDYFIEGGNNRVILATDGDFNVGPSSDSAMANLIEGKKKSGVFLSVMGFGTGNLQNSKMETLASHGNGNYSYINSIQEARKDMVRETGGTLLTIAKDVKIQVEFNPEEVKGYRLIGYENNMLSSKDFNNDKVDAAEIGAGHQATAIYEIIPADSSEDVTGSDLKYQATDAASGGEICTVSVRYKEPEGTNSKLLSFPVNGSIFSEEPSESFRFASAVAEFGLLLRDSKYKGDASLHQVLKLAQGSSDDDLKDEFISLVQMARDGGYRYGDNGDDNGN
jgi:Ca-activated chloride channel family protein